MRYSNLHLHDKWLPSRKWDQAHVYRMLRDLELPEVPLDMSLAHGGVIVFAAGDHEGYEFVTEANMELMPWGVLIATSDERSLFDWSKVVLPPWVKLWVQCPRVDRVYPEGARFFGEMSPSAGCSPMVSASQRSNLLHFRGQVQNQRRMQCWRALMAAHGPHVPMVAAKTSGFSKGVPRPEYLAELGDSVFVACPSGTATQDTFRVYEALEHGAIPIVDAVSPVDGSMGYWEMIGLGWLPQVKDWSRDLERRMAEMTEHADWQRITLRRWEAHKELMLADLRNDIAAARQEAYTK